MTAAVSRSLDVGAVRHLLRAPLHRAISFAEMILENPHASADEKLRSTVSGILNVCETALSMLGSASDSRRNDIAIDEVAPKLQEQAAAAAQLADAALSAVQVSQIAGAEADAKRILEASREFARELKRICHPESGARPTPLPEPPAATPAPQLRGLVLVIDDDEDNRDVLSRRLLRDGREVMLAEGGRQALRMLQRYPFDLVLLDIMMPDMDGYEVLAAIKADAKLKHLPVIMITAVDDVESIVRCVEMGADDYLLKPFNRVLLQARTNALLERKRLRDAEQRKAEELKQMLAEIDEQRAKSQALLENILPQVVADELRNTGAVQPMYFEDVTIVFADIVGFTLSTEQLPADELVYILHDYFTAFDGIMGKYGLEKLKTIGDCYMFAAGLPVRSPSNPVDSVLAALEMVHAVERLAETGPVDWRIRIGVNTGPVIAGVVGIRKFAFDIWGDAVNFSARVEAVGKPNRVNLSSGTYARVKDFFECEKQEKVRVKEGREVDTYLVKGVSTRLTSRNPSRTVREAFAQRYSAYFRKELGAFPAFTIPEPSTVEHVKSV
jgi:class 3 adenylate cyclase/CheY-like chemotaxis protein